jgi:hypothetical protein
MTLLAQPREGDHPQIANSAETCPGTAWASTFMTVSASWLPGQKRATVGCEKDRVRQAPLCRNDPDRPAGPLVHRDMPVHLGVEQDRGRPAPSCAPRRWVAMISRGIRITLRSNGLATPPPRPGESALPEPAPCARRVEPGGLRRPTLPRPSASEGGTRTFGHLENAPGNARSLG